jgi:hypothetical protein
MLLSMGRSCARSSRVASLPRMVVARSVAAARTQLSPGVAVGTIKGASQHCRNWHRTGGE